MIRTHKDTLAFIKIERYLFYINTHQNNTNKPEQTGTDGNIRNSEHDWAKSISRAVAL
jgi:hypothetical protein